jgi:hypothetical protein
LNIILAASTVLVWSSTILFFKKGKYPIIITYSIFAILLNVASFFVVVQTEIRQLLTYWIIIFITILISLFIILFIIFNKRKI